MPEYEHGPRLLPLVPVHDGFEIEQNYVGESSCVSFEMDFVFDFFWFRIAKSQSHCSLHFDGLLCGTQSFSEQFRENGLCGRVPVTTVTLEDRFCFRVIPLRSSPFHPTLANVAAHHVMNLNFVQFCPFFNPRERFKGRGVLGEKGSGL